MAQDSLVDGTVLPTANKVDLRPKPAAASAAGYLVASELNPLISVVTDLRSRFTEMAVNVKSYGATGDGETDDTAAIASAVAAAVAAGRPVALQGGLTYRVTESLAFLLASGARVYGNGAVLHVPDTAESGGDTTNNAIFYLPAGDDADDILIDGVHFDIDHADIDAIYVGATETTDAGARKRITVRNCYMTGGRRLVGARNAQVAIHDNHVYASGDGIFAQNCSGIIADNILQYVGVATDLSGTWANVQPIQAPQATGMQITGNTVEYSGGTAISITSNSATKDVVIANNVIRGAGLSGVGVGPKAASITHQNIVIANNVVEGFACAPDATAHSGIDASTTSISAALRNLVISGNVVSFIGPNETYDFTNHDVSGGKNDKKAKAGGFGFEAPIKVSGTQSGSDNSTIDGVQIVGNTSLHGAYYGVALNYLRATQVLGNTVKWAGYQRDASNLPLSAAAGINVTESLLVTVEGNTLLDTAPGCAGGNSFGIRFVRPWRAAFGGNQLFNAASGQCSTPISLIGSAGGFSWFGLSSATHEFHITGQNTAYNFVNALAYAPTTGTYAVYGGHQVAATWNPGNLADGAGETSSAITVTGAALGDFVLVSAPYDLQGVTCNGYVDAANSVKIRLQNETGGAVDLASGSWRVRVVKA